MQLQTSRGRAKGELCFFGPAGCLGTCAGDQTGERDKARGSAAGAHAFIPWEEGKGSGVLVMVMDVFYLGVVLDVKVNMQPGRGGTNRGVHGPTAEPQHQIAAEHPSHASRKQRPTPHTAAAMG